MLWFYTDNKKQVLMRYSSIKKSFPLAEFYKAFHNNAQIIYFSIMDKSWINILTFNLLITTILTFPIFMTFSLNIWENNAFHSQMRNKSKFLFENVLELIQWILTMKLFEINNIRIYIAEFFLLHERKICLLCIFDRPSTL